VPAGDILALLAAQPGRLGRVAATIEPASASGSATRAGKWSVREIFGHLVDAERVFGYRAFRIGRGDATPLASFEQEPYVVCGRLRRRCPLADAAAEFTRRARVECSTPSGAAAGGGGRAGVASGWPVTSALLFILAGHVEHHLRVLVERYDVSA
jgi:hypothetical protein